MRVELKATSFVTDFEFYLQNIIKRKLFDVLNLHSPWNEVWDQIKINIKINIKRKLFNVLN